MHNELYPQDHLQYSLDPINIVDNDDEMMQIYLDGLAHKYESWHILTDIITRENPLSFLTCNGNVFHFRKIAPPQ